MGLKGWDHLASVPGATVGPVASLPDVPAEKAKGRPRHERGVMNTTEQRYADYLEARKAAGEILAWMFEGITVRLSEKVTYTPDFEVMLADGTVELVDVKAGKKTKAGNVVPLIEDDATVKMKWAARASWFVVKCVWESGGQWCERVY